MRYSDILICDNDKDYVNDLIEYLMENKTNYNPMFSVTGCTDINEFKVFEGNFEYGLLGGDYYKYFNEESSKAKINKSFLLTEEPVDITETETFFKYQSMEKLDSILCVNKAWPNVDQELKMYGIYSPSKHELSLEFSLCVCKKLSLNSNLIFIDLSEVGILHRLLEIDIEEDLLDAIYMLENDENLDLGKYIYSFEGFSVFAPVLTPAQLPYISGNQWMRLFERIKENGYRQIVINFGVLCQGFSELVGMSEKLMVLEKAGEYYSIFEKEFMEYINKLGLNNKIISLKLPFTAANFSMRGFSLDSLMSGKMMEYVDEALKGNKLDAGCKTADQATGC